MFKVTNNPVHILDNGGRLSPSAFIPFCEIGGDMTRLSKKIDQFSSGPVCNSFRPRVLNDRLCYSLNPNDYIKESKDLKMGLLLVLDYNLNRQMMNQIDCSDLQGSSITSKVMESTDSKDEVSIYLDTLGTFKVN